MPRRYHHSSCDLLNSSNGVALWKKVALIPVLVSALLWLLLKQRQRQQTMDNNTTSLMSILWMAMQQHSPSVRVYRSMLELTIMLLCSAFSLWIWNHTNGIKGNDVLGKLLFTTTTTTTMPSSSEPTTTTTRLYEPVYSVAADHHENDDNEEENNNNEQGEEEDEYYVDNEDHLLHDVVPVVQQRPQQHHQPPTARSVLSATLDLFLLVLFSLFFFTWSNNNSDDDDGSSSNMMMISSPMMFPLLLFCLVVMVSFCPWNQQRHEFWMVIYSTMSAPFCQVSFRDGFVGDVLTSSVRPMQDLAFVLCWIISGVQGWLWSSSDNDESSSSFQNNLDHAADNLDHHNNDNNEDDFDMNNAATNLIPHLLSSLEYSWLLHTVVLPACMVSPLWWRFCQNLRQTYETKHRWPYLGNAFKYLIAAEVAIFGVYGWKQSTVWIMCFVFATLYQIWWDVFMDWELFVLTSTTITSSSSPSTTSRRRRLPVLRFQLRSTRLYPYRCVYYVIFVVNFVLRFGWTLSFLPSSYLHRSGILRDTFAQGEWTAMIGPFLASAEIVRRTLWGLLRVELEAIKERERDNDDGEQRDKTTSMEVELTPLSGHDHHDSNDDDDGSPSTAASPPPSAPTTAFTQQEEALMGGPMMPMPVRNDMTGSSDLQIAGELGLWAAVFCGLGLLAAAHRQTM